MKKVISVVAILMCMFCTLVGCGQSDEQKEIAELKSQINEMKSIMYTTSGTIADCTTKSTKSEINVTSQSKTTERLIIQTINPVIKRKKSVEKTTVLKEPIISASEIDLNYEILPPDSVGAVYINANYTNKSKYTITNVTYVIWLKDQDKKTYLSSIDTVLPNETSPKFDSFGPKSLNPNDIEFLKCNISVIDENGKKQFIEYDYKLKKYKVL